MLVAQYAVNGLLVGAVFALIGLGFSLVWGILNIINLAHAAFIMLGAYFTWMLVEHASIDPLLTVPIVALILFAIGYAMQRGLLNLVMRAPLLTTFLLTFGLETLILNLGQRIWSADTRSVPVAYSGKGIVLTSSGIDFGRPGMGPAWSSLSWRSSPVGLHWASSWLLTCSWNVRAPDAPSVRSEQTSPLRA